MISGSIYRKNRIKRCCHRVIFYKYNDVKSRVSFSPVKKVLRYSPMDSVAKLGNNKKRAVLTSLSTNMPTGTPDIFPFGGDVTEGTETFLKKGQNWRTDFTKKLQNLEKR